jgi:hypothetical protein
MGWVTLCSYRLLPHGEEVGASEDGTASPRVRQIFARSGNLSSTSLSV